MVQNYSISKMVIVAIAAIANNCFSEDEGGTRADEGGHWMIIINDELVSCLREEYLPLLLAKYLSRRITVWVLDPTWYTKMSTIMCTFKSSSDGHGALSINLICPQRDLPHGNFRLMKKYQLNHSETGVTEGSMYQQIVSYSLMNKCPSLVFICTYYLVPM